MSIPKCSSHAQSSRHYRYYRLVYRFWLAGCCTKVCCAFLIGQRCRRPATRPRCADAAVESFIPLQVLDQSGSLNLFSCLGLWHDLSSLADRLCCNMGALYNYGGRPCYCINHPPLIRFHAMQAQISQIYWVLFIELTKSESNFKSKSLR